MNIVVVLRGPAGVGKSTISKFIQDKLGVNWVVLDVDKFKHYMPYKPGQSNRAERKKIAHDVSKYFAQEMYAKGYDIIMEEMYKKPENDSLVTFLNENGMKFIKVFCRPPLSWWLPEVRPVRKIPRKRRSDATTRRSSRTMMIM